MTNPHTSMAYTGNPKKAIIFDEPDAGGLSLTGEDATSRVAEDVVERAARRRLTDQDLSKIAGGAYCFVEPDGAGFDMRDMAIELIERRALTAAGMHVVRTDALDPRTVEACRKAAEAAIIDARGRAAANFSPAFSGVRGEAYDRAVLDCALVADAAIRALIPQEQA